MPYVNLKAEMARHNVGTEEIATLIGIHRNSVYNKLNGASTFSVEEAISIRNEYFKGLSLDYLFDIKQKHRES